MPQTKERHGNCHTPNIMKISASACQNGTQLTLTKNGVAIGQCLYHAHTDANGRTVCDILQLELTPEWRRKGYGSFLLKDLLKRTGGYLPKVESLYRANLPTKPCPCDNAPQNAPATASKFSQTSSLTNMHGNLQADSAVPNLAAAFALFKKFGFVQQGQQLTRHRKPDLTALALMQQFITGHMASVQTDAPILIDATCGNGHDSLFLTRFFGTNGQLLAFDIQPEAILQTQKRLAAAGVNPAQYRLTCANHATLAQYAAPQSVDAILFNFGWLPGADHAVFSAHESSIPALNAALTLLKKGGILSAILYSGEGIGNTEKEAILAWMHALPLTEYTVLVCEFANWASTAPLPCFILKK